MKGKELVGAGTALRCRQRGRWPKACGVYATLAGRLRVFEREVHPRPRAIQLDRGKRFRRFLTNDRKKSPLCLITQAGRDKSGFYDQIQVKTSSL